jgi:hypothetical protein
VQRQSTPDSFWESGRAFRGVEVGAVASGPVSDAAIAALASAVFLATGVLVYIRGRRTGLVGTRGFGLYLFAAGAGVGFLALVLLLQES